MKIRAWRKSVLAFLMAGVLVFTSTGCVPGFSDKFWEELGWKLLDAWLTQHEANPRTPGGAANLAKRAASGSTGDAAADAAIGIFKQFDSIKEGDKLMAEGQQLRTQGKPSEAADAMDDAIAERPQDWTYRVSRASLAFQNDDGKIGEKQYKEGARLAGAASPEEETRYYTQTIDELESGEVDTSKMSIDTKILYYDQLRDAYYQRAEINYQETDRNMTQYYEGLRDDAKREKKALE